MSDHEACPHDWCLLIVCDDCGEMLTNPKPRDDGGYVGICHSHGRGASGVVMRRESCAAEVDALRAERDEAVRLLRCARSDDPTKWHPADAFLASLDKENPT